MNKTIWILFSLAVLLISCGAKTKKQTMVEIKTSLGTVTVKLYDETPLHKENFIKLVKKDFYNDILFHRVIKNFMVQAGDPDSKGAPSDKRLGSGGPGYTVAAEFQFPQYFHKRGVLSAARQSDQVNPKKESSGSQFYIVWGKQYSDAQLDSLQQSKDDNREREIFNRMVKERSADIQRMREDGEELSLLTLQEELYNAAEKEVKETPGFKFTDEQRNAYKTIGGTPHLDNEYTVFGEVVSGLDVIDRIQQAATGVADRPKEDIKIIEMKIVK